MDSTDYIEQIRKLQAELDTAIKECNEWKEKFERLTLYMKQPRLPVKGLQQLVGKRLTTVGWQDGDDLK